MKNLKRDSARAQLNGKFVIRNTTAFIGDDFSREDEVDILIEDGAITQIGRGIRASDATVVDGSEFFVTPGFVNAHFHPGQQLNRGLEVGVSQDAQMDLLHATERIKKKNDKETLSIVAVIEGLKAGTTTFYSVGSEIGSQVDAYKRLKVRATCVMMPKDINANGKEKHVRARIWDTDERIAAAEKMYIAHHDGILRVNFGVVNVRYASDRLILGMRALSRKYNTGFHMHASEGDLYVDEVVKRTGERPVEHLYRLGVLGQDVALAHMTKLNAREIGYLAKTGTHVIHCPRANSYIATGLCPVLKLIAAGVNVALGSDAASNNNSNEVRGEARSAFDRMENESGRADVISYKKLFSMLTVYGARAMGLEKEIGTIEIGKRADLVMWSKNDYPFIPGFNLLADLIFADSCRAHTVFVDGVIVLMDYTCVTVDEEAVKKKAMSVAKRYHEAFVKDVEGYLYHG